MTQLKVGLVGAGGIAPVHVAAWQSLGASIAVHSHVGAESLAEQYGLAVAGSLDELLESADVVDVVAPTAAHRSLALAAISAGKHVVCEKPLGATTAEAIEIVVAAREAGVEVFPAHVVRFFPEYAQIKEQIDAGRIGDPAVLRFTRAGQAPRAGSWFFSEFLGGGIVLDQMIHDLDQARWLAGEVTQVYAVQNPKTVGGVVPAIVTAQVVLTHEGGAPSHVQGSWGPEGMIFRTSVDVAGSERFIGYDSRNDGSVLLDLPSAQAGKGYLPPQTHAESPYTAQIREFAAALTGGAQPRVSPQDGILAIAEAARVSIESGEAVGFDSSTILAELDEERISA